jgi:hypothetical protein
MIRSLGVMAVLLLVSGCRCGGLDLSQETFACATDSDCVDGQRCVENVCAAQSTADASTDAGARDGGNADGGAVDAGGDAGRGDGGGFDAGTDAGTDGGFGLSAGPLCQAGWCWANPSPVGNSLNAATGTSPTDLWGGGEFGTVVHWDGLVMTAEYSPLGNIIGAWTSPSGAIYMMDNSSVWVRRPSGWSALPGFPMASALNGLWGIDDGHLWVVGNNGTILRWDGASLAVEPSPVDEQLLAISGLPSGELWAVGTNGTMLTSTGQGTWSQVTVFPADAGPVDAGPPPVDLRAVVAVSPTSVWASGGNLVAHFDGTGWAVSQAVPTNSNVVFSALGFDGTSVAAMAGYGGAWVLSGTTFIAALSFPSGQEDVSDSLGNCGPGCLVAGGLEGRLFVRSSTGRWSSAPTTGSEGGYRAVHGTAANDVWMVGARIRHWDGAQLKLVPENASAYFTGVYAATSTLAWATGNDGSIYAWNGTGWGQQRSAPFPPIALNAIHGTGASDVWAVGDLGTVLHFNGTSWSAVPSSLGSTLLAVHAVSATDVWFAGENGLVAHWDGMTFSPVPGIDPGAFMQGIWSDGSRVVAVGRIGFACYLAERASSSAGWLVPIGGNGAVTACLAVDGRGGRVWVGTIADGVGEWAGGSLALDRVASGSVLGVFAADATDVWMVGNYANILHHAP